MLRASPYVSIVHVGETPLGREVARTGRSSRREATHVVSTQGTTATRTGRIVASSLRGEEYAALERRAAAESAER